MRIRHPPGRGGRLWLADRLGTAARAADLLEQKERVLARERRRLVALEHSTSVAWEQAWRESQLWIARAVTLRGRRAIALATPREVAWVDLSWHNSMGAFYPAAATCRLPEELMRTGELAGTAAMTHAARSHGNALECAVQHGASLRAVREVERELRTTRHRLRMLRRQWIPSLRSSLQAVDIELEERERDDVMQARLAHSRGST